MAPILEQSRRALLNMIGREALNNAICPRHYNSPFLFFELNNLEECSFVVYKFLFTMLRIEWSFLHVFYSLEIRHDIFKTLFFSNNELKTNYFLLTKFGSSLSEKLHLKMSIFCSNPLDYENKNVSFTFTRKREPPVWSRVKLKCLEIFQRAGRA